MEHINLIPPQARKALTSNWIKKYILKSYASKVIMLILLLLISVFFYDFYASGKYKQKITLAKSQVKKLEMELEHSKDILAEIDKDKEALGEENKYIQKRLTYLEKAKTEGVKWSEVLSVLDKLTPAELWLSKVSFNKDAITINGTTADNAIVSGFMLKVEESGYFKDTSFNFTQKNKDKPDEPMTDFEVTTRLARY